MAKAFFAPIDGPEGWRALLADPEKHWRTGYSAKSLSYCWEEAKGFPRSVRAAFEASPYPVFHDLQFIAGFPEHKVWFPPRGARPSQNDLFVLGKGAAGLVSIAVEGKVSESFDRLVSEWKEEMSPGKDWSGWDFCAGYWGLIGGRWMQCSINSCTGQLRRCWRRTEKPKRLILHVLL